MVLNKAVNDKSEQIVEDIKKSAAKNDKLEKLQKLQACVNKVVNLPLSDIVMKDNVRFQVDEDSDDFKKLCESIQTFGLMKNIVADLRISQSLDDYELVCVSGHRRLTALQKLNYQEKIPVLIKQYEVGQRVGAALSENVNRKNLPFVDLATGYFSLKNVGWTDDDLVKHFEKDKKTIARYLRLGEMPDDVKKSIRDNPEVLNARTVFNDLLPKVNAPGEFRKAIERKLSKMPSAKTSGSERQKKITQKLEEFFTEKKLPPRDKETIVEALHYLKVLR